VPQDRSSIGYQVRRGGGQGEECPYVTRLLINQPCLEMPSMGVAGQGWPPHVLPLLLVLAVGRTCQPTALVGTVPESLQLGELQLAV
jgi:hypothetical protein